MSSQLTAEQIDDLRKLYELLAIATACARDALGPSGLPNAAEVERFKRHDEGASVIFTRIRKILALS